MPPIKGNEINDLVELLSKRNVKLYHACQLTDFKTYLELEGVPSRSLMTESELEYTSFETDQVDKDNGVWDKVFLNLEDFGNHFAQGKRNENTAPTPNPYGPVLLVFNPEVLLETNDVSLCLRSAGASNFNRETESLGAVEDINKIFSYDIESAPSDRAKAYVKYAYKLREVFPGYQIKSPEINCDTADGKVSFNHLHAIIVDSYSVNGKVLLTETRKLKTENGLTAPVWNRFYADGRAEIKQELASLLLEKVLSLNEILEIPGISEELRDYISRLLNGDMGFYFDRFAEYLHTGTISELSKEA